MSRSGARWGLAVAGVAGLSLVVAFAPAGGARTAATPVPVDCGAPITSWGGGIADDVIVDLLRVERVEEASAATPSATPAAARSVFLAELRVQNVGPTPATVAVAEITLVLCDGQEIQPTPDSTHSPFADGALAAGAARTGWVAFPLEDGDVPVRLIVPVSRRGLTGGRVEFPLVDPDAGTAVADSQGADGATGADAVGGDAVGGDGGDGADATAAGGDSTSDG